MCIRDRPRRGFASGTFTLEFQEENPIAATLHYGNDITGNREQPLDLNNCTSIKGKSDKFLCSIDVPLSDYDGEEIEYYFTLVDKVDQTDTSRTQDLDVDTTFPALNNPGSFWQQDTDNEKYIYFNLDITEQNFEEVIYQDTEETNPRWRRLCSRLKDGKCEVRKYFRSGFHILHLQITDEAGNAISTAPVAFNV